MTGSPLFVAADIHGHRAEFRAVLVDGGLADRDGRWTGRDSRLWLLGDYVDRGPDGLGVIGDIRALAASAQRAGGRVAALLGNHEVQLSAAYHFGTTPVAELGESGGFRGGWARCGGRDSDLRGLTPDHVAWMSGLPAMATVDGHLLVHSDTTAYLRFGADVDAVNATAARMLARPDIHEWVEFTDVLGDRGAFRGDDAGKAVTTMLDTFGGHTLVHGHSTLTTHFGVPPGEVTEALRYAGGRVLAVDGGVYEGGAILLTRLT